MFPSIKAKGLKTYASLYDFTFHFSLVRSKWVYGKLFSAWSIICCTNISTEITWAIYFLESDGTLQGGIEKLKTELENALLSKALIL